MKKRIICIAIVGIFLLTGITTSLVVGIKTDSNEQDPGNLLLDQQQTQTRYKDKYMRGLSNPMAQSFTPTLTSVAKLELFLGNTDKYNSDTTDSCNLKVSIKGSVWPFGTVYGSTIIDASDIPWPPGWVEVDIDANNLRPGGKYYIVVEPCGTIDENDCIWVYIDFEDEDNDVYLGGEKWYYQPYPVGGNWRMQSVHDSCFMSYGINMPPEAPTISGPTKGKTGVEYIYTISSKDPEGHKIYYDIDWGDGNKTTVKAGGLYYVSGEKVNVKYTWNNKGSYTIRVKAIDEHYAEGDWSDFYTVTISKSKSKSTMPFLFAEKFLQNHPHLFLILRQLVLMVL